MCFECLDLGVPLVFRQVELALSSIQGRVDSVFEWMLGSVIVQPILPVWLIPESMVLPCEDRLLRLCVGKPQLRHVPTAKK